MVKKALVLLVVTAGLLSLAGAQVVTFNNPSPWVSLRAPEIVVKTLLDTAKLEKKSVNFVLYKIENGRKKKLGSESIGAREYSHEFTLATVANKVLGGRDYLKVEWAVSEKGEKGSLEPFGILVVDSGKVDTVAVGKHVQDFTLANAKAALTDGDFVEVGGQRFGIVWTKRVLGLVYKKGGENRDLTFTLDGKNGKNAFLAYADRFIAYGPEADSLHTWHYKRSVSDTGIVYKEEQWINEIGKAADDEFVLITVPWYDTGIIPFDGRMIGFAVFSGAAAAKPGGAKRNIPGTWGDLVLVGGPKEPTQ
jgi:hypothetical protein